MWHKMPISLARALGPSLHRPTSRTNPRSRIRRQHLLHLPAQCLRSIHRCLVLPPHRFRRPFRSFHVALEQGRNKPRRVCPHKRSTGISAAVRGSRAQTALPPAEMLRPALSPFAPECERRLKNHRTDVQLPRSAPAQPHAPRAKSFQSATGRRSSAVLSLPRGGEKDRDSSCREGSELGRVRAPILLQG